MKAINILFAIAVAGILTGVIVVIRTGRPMSQQSVKVISVQTNGEFLITEIGYERSGTNHVLSTHQEAIPTQPAYRPPTATNVYRAIADDYFDTGLRLGWSCRNHGGTKDDAEYLINAHRSNQVNAAQQWFKEHPVQ